MLEPGGTSTRRGCEYFLRVIPSLDGLPQAVQTAIRQVQSPDPIRQIFYIPSQQYPIQRTVWGRSLAFGWRRTPPRTLAFGVDHITVVEGLDAQNTLHIPLSDLLTIRLVTVLLYSYIELVWRVGDQTQMIKVEFNSVGSRHIEKELVHVRTWIAAQEARPVSWPEISIQHFPLKFFNYSMMSLLPGEQIIGGVFEPAIQGGGLLSPAIAPNRAVILTEQHLIIISDHYTGSRETSINTYRMDRCYCPRAQVTQIQFEPQARASWLTITLAQGVYDIRLPLLEPRATEFFTTLEAWLSGVSISSQPHVLAASAPGPLALS
ncbi:MAG: hypothetical protein HY866_00760 [Chloroflexi bacterium]|nr:hypothetical protein [Chloroflexota bacterium]